MGGSGSGGGGRRRGATRPPKAGGNGASPQAQGGGGVLNSECLLRFTTALANVDPMASLTLSVNDRLAVTVQTYGTVDVAEVTTANGNQPVGVINAPETVALIECMRAGHTYVAIVLALPDPLTVRVQNQ